MGLASPNGKVYCKATAITTTNINIEIDTESLDQSQRHMGTWCMIQLHCKQQEK